MKTKGKNPPRNINFQDYISINSKMLQFMGLVIGVEGNKRDIKSQILEKLPMAFINIVCIVDAVFQFQWIMDLWDYDKNFVMQIATGGFSNIMCICKGIRLAYCREDLQTLFEELALICRGSFLHTEDWKQIIKTAQNTLFFLKCYIGMMIALVACFGLPPLKNLFFHYFTRVATNYTYDYTNRVFLLRYPFEIKNLSIYLSVLIHEELVLICDCLYWVCCDTLFAQITTHTSIQFQILQHDIETAVNQYDENNEDSLKRNLIDFVKRHQELLRICELIEKIFSPVILSTMLLTSISICVNVFELREMITHGNVVEVAMQISHVANVFFQLLVYCVYAERLTQQTISIANATYDSEWTDKNCKFRVYFQTLIMKSQKPFYFSAYGYFPIGHTRITIIVNRAISFYMMLETIN